MRLSIYYPKHYNANNDFDKSLVLKLTKAFNGLTIIPQCFGTWINPKTKHVIQDPITIFEIYTTEEVFKQFKIRAIFFECIEQIKKSLKQTTVAYTINHNIEFY